MLLIYIVCLLILSDKEFEPLVWLVIIFYFAGPAGLVAVTLLLLMNFDTISEALKGKVTKRQLTQVVYLPIGRSQVCEQSTSRMV
mmetsp:Transcript_3668/g.4490  ORF Transcript_3668/g.4490 Transcript_3668/m.4490 type:complete len:85 (-) Transcript_3668:48-302(-)